MLARWFEDDFLQANLRVRAIRFVNDLFKIVVSYDGQPVHGTDACALAVWPTQTMTPDGLLDENVGVGRAPRDDGLEICHVLSLFKHVVSRAFTSMNGFTIFCFVSSA